MWLCNICVERKIFSSKPSSFLTGFGDASIREYTWRRRNGKFVEVYLDTPSLPSLSPLRVITRSCEIAAHPAFSLYFICTLSSLEMGREDLAGVKERPLLPLTLYPKPCAAKGNGPWRAINFVLVEHLTPWKFPSVLSRERYFPQIIPLDHQQCISYPSLCKKKEKVQFSSGDNSSSSINEEKIHRTGW